MFRWIKVDQAGKVGGGGQRQGKGSGWGGGVVWAEQKQISVLVIPV